jgi:hypothetical protein
VPFAEGCSDDVPRLVTRHPPVAVSVCPVVPHAVFRRCIRSRHSCTNR